jgi:hypothetical protein
MFNEDNPEQVIASIRRRRAAQLTLVLLSLGIALGTALVVVGLMYSEEPSVGVSQSQEN